MPDATPTSIAPPSPARRNRLWIAAQVAITAVILWVVGRKLLEQWSAFRDVPLVVRPRWAFVALSALLVLAAFFALIETWRRMIVAWGNALTFAAAARIWWVSALLRYLPWNVVFQLGAVAELSRRQQISPVAATGASVINVAVNIATGFVVALVVGFDALNTLSNGHATAGVFIAAAALVGILMLPLLLPPLLRLARTITRRDLAIGVLPHRAIYLSFAGNVVAWVLYGIAYRSLVIGVIGTASGSAADYIAVYAASYVIGYLAIALPAGVGVRESVQIGALPALGLATTKQAAVIAVSARLLLTILELVPGLLLLARGTGHPRPQAPTPVDGPHP